MTQPAGTVTFLFTDIEGSTRLWEAHPAEMFAALARHDDILRHAIEAFGGVVFKTVGDAFCAAFASADAALGAALDAQLSLAAEPWPDGAAPSVRMAVHSGAAELRDGDYFGPPLNRVARLLALGHGGQVLASAAAYQLAADRMPQGAGLRELGSHRLRDLDRPETVYQLAHADLRTSFPPLRSAEAAAPPNNLPEQATSFVGRAGATREAKRLLAAGRLVSLVGAGGAGKSRLALQVAGELLHEFVDGAWLAELAALTDGALIGAAVVAALGLREEQGRRVETELTEFLRSRALLLILDNAEHLLQPCAELAAAILKSSPAVRLLVTSREPLGIYGEAVYRVPSLDMPDEGQAYAAEELARFEAVRLFVERAVSVDAAFRLDDESAAAVGRICRRLDGIPLAIELASARIRSLSAAEIEARLEDRFRLLTGGSRTALPRQQTLRALIDWSYALLADREKTAVRRMSVFSGGCDLAAAESVLSAAPEVESGVQDVDVLDILTSLVDKSLVAADKLPGGARYRLLETVRQYGRDRLLESGEAAALRDVHRDYYRSLAASLLPRLPGGETDRVISLLRPDQGNLRVAFEWTRASGSGPEAVLRLAVLWAAYCDGACLWAEARADLDRVLGECATAEQDPHRVDALVWSGQLAQRQGEYRLAETLYQRGMKIYQRCGDAAGEACALRMLADLSALREDYAAALAAAEKALELCRSASDRDGEALSLRATGRYKRSQGRMEEAWSAFQEAIRLHLELGQTEAANWDLQLQSVVAEDRGDIAGAVACLERAIALGRKAHDRSSEASAMNNLALLYYLQGDYSAARAQFERALEMMRGLADPRVLAYCLNDLGRTLTDLGELDEARQRLNEGLKLRSRLGHRPLVVWSIANLAYLASRVGETRRAIRLYAAASALRRSMGTLPRKVLAAREEADVEALRAALGPAEFEAAWRAGESLSESEAVEYSLWSDGEE